MPKRKMTYFAELQLTQEMAAAQFSDSPVEVMRFVNQHSNKFVMHRHPSNYEFILVLSGSARYFSEGYTYDLRAGEMISIPPGVDHQVEAAQGPHGYHRIVLHVEKAFMDEVIRSEPLLKCCVFQADTAETIILSADAAFDWNIQKIIEQFQSAENMEALSRERMRSVLLMELILSIEQIVKDEKANHPAASHPAVVEVIAYMHMHYKDSDLNVSRLAEHVFISREHLSRLFKENTMQSVQDHLLQLRMRHCREEIEQGARVMDACMRSGFSSYNSFFKSFVKLYGIAPSEYVKQYRMLSKS